IAPGTGGTPPQGRLEAEVCRIFGEVLELSVHGRDGSFFDLGGRSLAARRAVCRISDELGVDVQAGTLMAAPTPAGLVAALQEPRGVAGLAPTLVLRAPTSGASERPVFCVHPAGGFAWQFAPLTTHLPSDVPVVGLQTPALSGQESGAESVAELAGEYVARIRETAPSGPYRLVGYSYGGNIAHDMAAQLVAAGEEVQLLVLIDPGPLDGDRRSWTTEDAEEVRLEQEEFFRSLYAENGPDDHEEALASIRASRGVLGGELDDDL